MYAMIRACACGTYNNMLSNVEHHPIHRDVVLDCHHSDVSAGLVG